jgi:hypothetical protein
MGIKQDWILTQINMLIAFIAKVFFDRKPCITKSPTKARRRRMIFCF